MNSAYNRTETKSFLEPQAYDIIPPKINGKKSLGAFKFVINQKIVHADCTNVIKMELDLIQAWNH